MESRLIFDWSTDVDYIINNLKAINSQFNLPVWKKSNNEYKIKAK